MKLIAETLSGNGPADCTKATIWQDGDKWEMVNGTTAPKQCTHSDIRSAHKAHTDAHIRASIKPGNPYNGLAMRILG